MSHFNVIVIGDNHGSQLAPFQENNMGDCPQEFLKFHDQTKALQGYVDSGDYSYSSLQDAAEDHGYNNKHNGKYGYWENPNAKWDWYVVGGRWSGNFDIRVTARPHTFGSAMPRPLPENPGRIDLSMNRNDQKKRDQNLAEGCADWALKSAVDVERTMNKGEARARARWMYWAEALQGRQEPETWTVIRERNAPNVEAARIEYKAQPVIIAWHKAYERRGEHSPYGTNPVEDYGFDLHSYIARIRRQAPVPFAYLHNGEWHERGSMGMFGCISDEKNRCQWVDTWEQLWSSLPDNARLTCIDCHI